MKNLILLTCLLALTLPRVSLAADNHGKAEIAFSEGLLLHHKKDFKGAEQRFAKAVQLDPRHKNATYFLGLSQSEQEKYEAAIKSFTSAIALQTEEPEPYFYRALAYYHLKKSPEALADFQKAQKLAPAGQVKDLATSYIRSMTQKETPLVTSSSQGGSHRWFANGSLTTQYDTNVTLNPDAPSAATLPTDKNDLQFAIRGGGGYHIIRKDHYRLTTEGSYYQSIYTDLDRFNYGLLHLEVNNQFKFGNFSIRTPTGYEFSLLGRDKYLGAFFMKPTFSYLLAKRLLTQFSPRLRYEGFFQTLTNQAQNRDAWNIQLEIDEFLMGEDQKHYLKLSYIYEKNAAKGNDWDYHAHRMGLAFLTPIPWGIDFDIHTEFTIDRKFAHVDSIIGTQRDDFGQAFGLSLSRKIMDHLSVRGHYDFFRNTSNQTFFTYGRHIAGVTFATSF